MRENTGVNRDLVGKHKEKRPSVRCRLSWEDSIKMDLQEEACGGMEWIKLALDRHSLRDL
jgi:hypothetical protein